MVKPNAAGPRYPIRNRAALRTLVERLVAKSPRGLVGLAERSKIGRDTLYRWLGERSPRMPHAMAVQLETFVRNQRRPALYRLFLKAMGASPESQRMMAQWRGWTERQAAERWKRPGTFWGRRKVDGRVVLSPVTDRAERRRARAVFAYHLDKRVSAEVPEFTAFKQEMARQRIEHARRAEAVRRILEPYLDAPESGWVELGWDDLELGWDDLTATERRLMATKRRTDILEAIRRERRFLAGVRRPQDRAERLTGGSQTEPGAAQ